jgi:hypothetical protein
MADVQTSGVDEQLPPVTVGLWTVKYGKDGNQIILLWQFKLYFCKNESHIWSHLLNTDIMAGDITMEIKVRSLR